MRCIFASSFFLFVTTKYVSAVTEPKSLHPEWTLHKTVHTDNVSIVPIEISRDSIPQRVLLYEKIPLRGPVLVHQPNPKLETRKCQHPTLQKGQVKQHSDCDTVEYTTFSQVYMPTLITTGNKKLYREVDPNEADDWNHNLKIHGLWPERSKFKSKLPFTRLEIDEINQHDWPTILKDDVNHEMYAKEWKKYGVKSGLSPLDYIREIHHLHQRHPTPLVIRESTTEISISLTKLKEGFHRNACLLCRSRKDEKLFIGVHYCHKVNPKTHKAEEIVPYEKCGICAPKMPCNLESVIIPKLVDKEAKCEPGVCNEKEYTIFAQSYMPTLMITGQLTLRTPEPDEVDDWNSNLKIHGLLPRHYNVKPSTLPFTPEAAAAVDENDWPTIRTQSRKSYEFQWDTNGVKTGLEPLEYVRETQRVHKLHPTPDMLKGVFPHEQIIPLATLKKLFNANACLLCRPRAKKEIFNGLHICHKVNSKTRQMEEVVPFHKCAICSACSQEKIILPKIANVESKKTKTRFKKNKTQV